MHAKSFQSHPTLCDPMDYSLPGSSLHGIFQSRILEWIATLSCRGSSLPRDRIWVLCIAGRFFTIWVTREAPTNVLVTQLCPSLCDSMDSIPPDASIHEILQPRKLEWIAIPFSRGSSQRGTKPGSPALQVDLYYLRHQRFPKEKWFTKKISRQRISEATVGAR